MSSPRLALVFLAALVVAVVATTPMTVGLDLAGAGQRLTAREVRGTLWNGRLVGASLGAMPLGDVRARLSLAGLARGRPAIDVIARGGAVDGRGRILLGGSSGVEDFTGSIPLEHLGAPSPIGGTLVLRSAGFAFSNGACRHAAGQASAEVRGLGEGSMTLSGRPVCRAGAMVLPLSGERDGVRVAVSVSLKPDGEYATEARVTTADVALGEVLSAAGFEKTGDGYLKISNGRLA